MSGKDTRASTNINFKIDLGYRLEGQAENHRSSREVPGPVENGGSRPW